MTFRLCKTRFSLAGIYPGSLGLTVWIYPAQTEEEKAIVAELQAAIKNLKE